MQAIIVIDTGSSSMKGTLCSTSAQALFRRRVDYSVEADGRGAVEQDPLVFRRALLDVVRDTYAYAKSIDAEVIAFSLTSQRSSLIALDAGGNPLRNTITWHDKRSAPICDEINASRDIFAICGMDASPVFSAPKMLWLKRNEPDAYRLAHKLAGIHDYLLFLMTGLFVTDASFASRTCLLDLRSTEWSGELLDLFEVEPDKLCRIMPAGQVCSATSAEFGALCGLDRPITVVSAGGDQQCAALGLGAGEKGRISVNCGTGAYACALVDRPTLDKRRAFLCNVAAEGGRWQVEASTPSSGLVYRWVSEVFYGSDSFEKINEDAARAETGASGLIMLSDLMGRGSPQWDSLARGTFHNIGMKHERRHFARAALEGIAAALSDCVGVVGEAFGEVGQIQCSGGLTRSGLFNQILADTCGIPVAVRDGSDGTCLGAWASAMIAMGLASSFHDALGSAVMGDQKVYYPDEERRRVYRSINEARDLVRASLDARKLRGLLETAQEQSAK